jgi:fructose-1,6-bisphosphatase/inositol monophosphatase family enzyme
MAVVDTDDVLRLLQDVAAEVITPRFRDLADGQIHEKRPGDLVTIADHEAEVLITQALTAAFPGAVVLGEEAYAADRTLLETFLNAGHGFTVDPVDGTKNFVNGSPDHAVMVAETRGGQTVRAWIWQPQHELAYVAERGAGAYRNGTLLTRPSPSGDPAEWRGVTSRRAWLGRELPGLRPLELTWVCCGVDYPRLIEGAADFICYGGANPWDHAPGTLLLEESGGYAGLIDGQPYRPTLPGSPVPVGLIAAADRATYDVVRTLLP